MVRNDGFTLLELLIASAVFAVMSALAYAGLSQLADHDAWLERHERQFAAVQRTMQLLQRDLTFATRRSIRDALGTPIPAMLGGRDAQKLSVTRTRLDRAGDPGLLRVDYELVDGTLRRGVWPVLDRMPQHRPLSHDLLDGVAGVAIRFLDSQRWRTDWPVAARPSGAGDNDDSPLPRAVEVTVTLDHGATYRRIFAVAGSA